MLHCDLSVVGLQTIVFFKFLIEDNLGYGHLLPLNDTSHDTKGHDLKLAKGRFTCQLRKFSFSFRVVNTWNALKPLTVHATNVTKFKKLLDDELISMHYQIDSFGLKPLFIAQVYTL